MNKLLKGYLSGFVSAAIVTTVVFSAPIQKELKVVYNNIKIYVDGIMVEPKDAKGNEVEPFISNGTTYLPIRAVSQALGKKVEWDDASKSVYIGERINNDKTDVNGTAKSPQIEGMKIFPPDNFWNTPIDKMPVHPNSEEYISTIGKNKTLHPDFGTFWEGKPIGIPYNIVTDSQPMVSVKFDYDEESDPGPYPIPSNPLIEAGSDRHMLILRQGSNILYELFDARKGSNGSWSAGSGAIWHLDKNEVRKKNWTSADAAGLAILPGLVRWDEVYKNKEINHALRITVSKIQKAYISPASHSGGRYTEPNYPPMGLRLRLKKDFNITGYDEHIQVILKAFKTYGVVIADVGSDMYVSGVHDTRWDDDVLRALKKVTASSFEAVYTGDAVPYGQD